MKQASSFFPRRRRLFCLLLLLCAFFSGAASAGGEARPVYLIPVSGDVEPGMAAYIERCLAESRNNDKALIVLELDTFGGRVDSALAIVDILLAAAPRSTVAYVQTKAISAGALIALACNRLVMKPHSTIGDCAPITFAQDGPKMLGEKFQSPLRAKFRTLARKNGYPERLAEAMVTAEMEVLRIVQDGRVRYLEASEYNELSEAEKKTVREKKTVVAKGALLTMDNEEALTLGFSSATAENIEELLAGMAIGDYTLIRQEQNWSETLGRFITAIAPVLVMIGLAALYIEYKAPGFGLPGIVGLFCLGLVLFNQYLMGLAGHTELLLILLGVVLLAMEIFVLPGFGIAGLAGIFAICLGLILSFQDFVLPDPAQPWQKEILLANISVVLGSFVFAFLSAMLFLRYLLPRLAGVVAGPYLASDLADSHADSTERAGVAAGSRGLAQTPLRPAGKMRIGETVIDVVTEGEFIEKGSPLVVSALRGNVVVVRREGP
ncbi:NfeD family protein [Thiovibrio sp. JS02]